MLYEIMLNIYTILIYKDNFTWHESWYCTDKGKEA
jgi:hypothetical protein